MDLPPSCIELFICTLKIQPIILIPEEILFEENMKTFLNTYGTLYLCTYTHQHFLPYVYDGKKQFEAFVIEERAIQLKPN